MWASEQMGHDKVMKTLYLLTGVGMYNVNDIEKIGQHGTAMTTFYLGADCQIKNSCRDCCAYNTHE